MAKSNRHKKMAAKKVAAVRARVKANIGKPKKWTAHVSWSRYLSTNRAATFNRTIQIFELAEKMLSYLPPEDLVRVENVNFKMKSTVAQSGVLQEMLFKRADWTQGDGWRYTAPSEGDDGDDDLLEITNSTKPCDWVWEAGSLTIYPKVINSAILSLPNLDATRFTTVSDQVKNRIKSRLCAGPPLSQYENLSPTFDLRKLSASSSVNDMFLTQPPSRRVRVIAYKGRMDWWDDEIKKDAGVTMGDIGKLLRETAEPLDDSIPSYGIELDLYDGIPITLREKKVVEAEVSKHVEEEEA